MRKSKESGFQPFVGFKPYTFPVGPPAKFAAILEVGECYFCVEQSVGLEDRVVMFVAPKEYFPDGRYTITGDPVLPFVALLKTMGLQHGAARAAIELVGCMVPLTTEERTQMASAKLTKNKGDAEALKTAAKAAPVGGKKGATTAAAAAAAAEPAKKKGNVEALQKAREARAAAGPDTRKIVILNKENPYRAESNRATAFSTVLKAKTVEAYKEAGGPAKYLKRWADEGRIELK